MRYILSLLALLATFTAVAQQEEQSVAEQAVAVEFDNMTLWERGNQSYIDGDYAAVGIDGVTQFVIDFCNNDTIKIAAAGSGHKNTGLDRTQSDTNENFHNKPP